MAFNKFIILVLALSSLLSFYAEAAKSVQPEHDDDPLLRKICRGCQYPADCYNYISPELAGKEVNSLTALQAGLKVLSGELQKAIDQTYNALSQAKSTEAKQILDQYLKAYQEVIQTNERAKSAVATQQIGSMESDLVMMESKMTNLRNIMFEKMKTIPDLQKLSEQNSYVFVIVKNNVGIGLDANKPQYDD